MGGREWKQRVSVTVGSPLGVVLKWMGKEEDEKERWSRKGGEGAFLYRPGWASSKAGRKPGTKLHLRSDAPPLLLLYRLHVSSARCTVLSKDHLGERWRGKREISRPPTYNHVFLLHFHCLLRSLSSLNSSASIQMRQMRQTRLNWDFKRCLMLKTPPRSVFVCLPPSLPSVPLPPSSGLHFAYSICWLLPWAMIPFTSENSAPFILSLGRRKKKILCCCHLICHQHFFCYY